MTRHGRALYQDVPSAVLPMAWALAQVLLDAAELLELTPQLASDLALLHTGIVAEMEHRVEVAALARHRSSQPGSIG
jgi:hypothetical protein